MTLDGMDQAVRTELLAVFPALAVGNADHIYPAARPSLKGFEVPLILTAEGNSSGYDPAPNPVLTCV